MSILVFCESENGAVKKTAHELLGKAASLGGPVTAFVVNANGDLAGLGAWGAQRVLSVTVPEASFTTGSWTGALVAAIQASGATTVLGSASAVGRGLFARAAARLDSGVGEECTELAVVGGAVVGRRPVYAGKATVQVAVRGTPAFYTVRPNSFGAPQAGQGSAEVATLAVSLTDADVLERVVEVKASEARVADLTEAERIVSGGRSLKSEENFKKVIVPLAAALGATPGASRAAVDAGYAPHSWQVGQTGKVVNPQLYIACGISGAIQHLAGMRTSKVIVAINKDADAQIFQHASYGIVDDLFEVCPALTARLQSL